MSKGVTSRLMAVYWSTFATVGPIGPATLIHGLLSAGRPGSMLLHFGLAEVPGAVAADLWKIGG